LTKIIENIDESNRDLKILESSDDWAAIIDTSPMYPILLTVIISQTYFVIARNTSRVFAFQINSMNSAVNISKTFSTRNSSSGVGCHTLAVNASVDHSISHTLGIKDTGSGPVNDSDKN